MKAFIPALKAVALVAALILPAQARADCVVLLHGLGRHSPSMLVPALYLQRQGYQVVNHGYPSTSAPIEDLAGEVGVAVAECPSDEPLHIVTHSMGGILARLWLQDHRPENLGRVVMLAPPNQGSPLVDVLTGLPGYRLLNGPAGQQLGTDAAALPLTLGPVDFPLGVIAGSASANPLSSALIPGPDDGKVGVSSSRVEGMQDHITLPVTHTFLMNNPQVLNQIVTFLRDGRFARQTDR